MSLQSDNITMHFYYQPQFLIFLFSYFSISPELNVGILKLILVRMSFIN